MERADLVPGRDATVTDPATSTQFALDLAALIARLRAVDTRGRTFRGTNPAMSDWGRRTLQRLDDAEPG